ncbi:MAG: GntR family transcriptional regulator [Spirochaetales bacterium]|nr:GntR family transcriptional regulator [Spirochaetales bacterium]
MLSKLIFHEKQQESGKSLETAPEKKELLRYQVRRALVNMILRHELKPGTRIPQERIAEKLHVSRGVLRETLLSLQSTFLVELLDNRGAYVGRLDEEKMSEIYKAREAIECMVVRLCCMRVNRLQTDELRQIIIREQMFIKKGDEMAAAQMDKQFHNRLLELSGNHILQKIMDEHLVLTKIFRTRITDQDVTCKDHFAVIDAIQDNNVEQAEKIMRQHIRTGWKHIQRELVNKNGKLDLIPIEENMINNGKTTI